MFRRPAPLLATAALLLAFGCGADDDSLSTEEAARLCDAAVEKLADCFGVSVTFTPCDGARAQSVVDMSCGQIVEDLAQPKADDPEEWFCSTFPEVCELCDEDPAAC
jgi:hypothetical protein